MQIETVVVGFLQTNCYIVYDENEKKGVVIDPGAAPDRIIEHIKKSGCKIEYILLTHAHYDHIGALAEVKKYTGAKVVVPLGDVDFLYNDDDNLWNRYSRGERERVSEDITVRDNDTVMCAGMEFRYIETPGHTNGSCCILCGDAMFSGDTLFQMTVGRVDHPTGDFNILMQSVEKMKKIDKNYTVYPGHAGSTTLDFEKQNNPYFNN